MHTVHNVNCKDISVHWINLLWLLILFSTTSSWAISWGKKKLFLCAVCILDMIWILQFPRFDWSNRAFSGVIICWWNSLESSLKLLEMLINLYETFWLKLARNCYLEIWTLMENGCIESIVMLSLRFSEFLHKYRKFLSFVVPYENIARVDFWSRVVTANRPTFFWKRNRPTFQVMEST